MDTKRTRQVYTLIFTPSDSLEARLSTIVGFIHAEGYYTSDWVLDDLDTTRDRGIEYDNHLSPKEFMELLSSEQIIELDAQYSQGEGYLRVIICDGNSVEVITNFSFPNTILGLYHLGNLKDFEPAQYNPPSHELFVCSCTDVNHQLILTKFDDEEEYYLSVKLNLDVPLWKRIYNAIKYIRGINPTNYPFSEVLLDKPTRTRLANSLLTHD